MKSDISEFSYGYALTSEIVQSCGSTLVGAPVFPSLIAEGSLGYDLELPVMGSPIFLQFKLCDYMKRSTAEGADLVPVPHYRMHLRPLKHSQQHALLCAMESAGKSVFYAAPEFHKPTELNDAYLTSQMIARSAFFRPNAIGALPDDDEHFVCFNSGATFGYRYSEPYKVEKIVGGKLRHILTEQSPDNEGANLPARLYLPKVADQLIKEWTAREGQSKDVLGFLAEIRSQRGPREYLGWVAQTLFDCATFVRLHPKTDQA
jgi:hypothetical protein